MKLTVGMIVKNEERYLEGCLKALKPLTDNPDVELIVGDTGSSDGTLKIIEEYHARLLSITWHQDFAKARNEVLREARGQWFFYLDADEHLEDPEPVVQFFKSGEYKKYGSASVIIHSFLDRGKRLYSDIEAVRLFRIQRGSCFTGAIHETIATEPPVKRLGLRLLHYGYQQDDKEQAARKRRRNLPILEEEFRKNPGDIRKLNQLIRQQMFDGEYDQVQTLVREGLELERKNPDLISYCFLYNIKAKLCLIRKDSPGLLKTVSAYFEGKRKACLTDLDIYAYAANLLGAAGEYESAFEYFNSYQQGYEKYCEGSFDSEDHYYHELFYIQPERHEKMLVDFAKCCLRLKRPGMALDLLGKLFNQGEEIAGLKERARQLLDTEDGVLTIHTGHIDAPLAGNDLYTSRERVEKAYGRPDAVMASVAVMGYNGLEKTRRCVSCVLAYTKDVDYELILIDNGSDDGTLEYFKSVSFPRKRIIRVTKNIGAAYGANTAFGVYQGRYLAIVSGDICVTPCWLSNLLRCMESDRKIGLALPMSTNTSNLQQPAVTFDSFEDMQKKARAYNKSDPLKWQERLRLVTVIMIYKRELVELIGKQDTGFFHDFLEDDYTTRIRRAGYKLILCGDTFIHHDHKRPAESEGLRRSIESGRQNYREKYHGLDAWDDINNYEYHLLELLNPLPCSSGAVSILGVDIRCGTPVLEIRNRLRRGGITSFHSEAFTTQAKYYEDLLTACDRVLCGTVDSIGNCFAPGSFDYLILGEPVNAYPYPIRLLEQLLFLLKPGGQLLFKLQNTYDLRALLEALGENHMSGGDMVAQIAMENIYGALKLMKVSEVKVQGEGHDTDPKLVEGLRELVHMACEEENTDSVLKNLRVKNYLFAVTK